MLQVVFKIKFQFIFLLFISVNQFFAQKIIIADRDASNYVSEGDFETKELRYDMDADYIYQNVVLTKDNVAVVFKDVTLDKKTNVTDVYKRKKRDDDHYYVVDFTFKQLQKLRVFGRKNKGVSMPKYTSIFNYDEGDYRVHSLEEELELIKKTNSSKDKKTGVYIQIVDPEFHLHEKKDITEIVIGLLSDYGYNGVNSNCFVSSYDGYELRRIKEQLHSKLKLIQLFQPGYKDVQFRGKPASLIIDEVGQYAQGIGLWYKHLLNIRKTNIDEFSAIVGLANYHGILVHTYGVEGNNVGQYSVYDLLLQALIQKGIDGIMTDHPNLTKKYFKQKSL